MKHRDLDYYKGNDERYNYFDDVINRQSGGKHGYLMVNDYEDENGDRPDMDELLSIPFIDVTQCMLDMGGGFPAASHECHRELIPFYKCCAFELHDPADFPEGTIFEQKYDAGYIRPWWKMGDEERAALAKALEGKHYLTWEERKAIMDKFDPVESSNPENPRGTE